MIYANITYVTQPNLMFFYLHLARHYCKLWETRRFSIGTAKDVRSRISLVLTYICPTKPEPIYRAVRE